MKTPGSWKTACRKLLLSAAAAAALASTLCLFAFGIKNSLLAHGHWTVGPMQRLDTSQAICLHLLPAPLAKGRLRLSFLGGRNEIASARTAKGLTEISFSFLTGPDEAWIEAGLLGQSQSLCGLRISATPNRKSLFFNAAPGGRFTAIAPAPQVEHGVWHRARIKIGESEITADIDGRPFGTFDRGPEQGALRTVFRSGPGLTLLDDIEVKTADGPIISENFSPLPDSPFVPLALFALFFCLCLPGLSRPGIKRQKAFFAAFAAYAFMHLGAGFFLSQPGNDTKFLNMTAAAARAPELWRAVKTLVPPDEAAGLRRALAPLNPPKREDGAHEHTTERLRQAFGDKAPLARRRIKIIFLGTADSLDPGAKGDDRDLASVTAETLARDHNFTLAHAVCINAGTTFRTAKETSERYVRDWAGLGQDVCVINLCGSGPKPTGENRLRHALEAIAGANMRRFIKTVFLVTPRNGQEPELAVVMRETAVKFGMRVWNLHAYIRDRQDTGLVWRDSSRLTPYGEKLAGEFLADKLSRILTSIKTAQNHRKPR